MMEIAEGRNIIGKYRLERPLAGGGMGAVWLGFDLKLRRRVVVKFLRLFSANDPAMVTRFEREARAAARVRSPHVIETYDFGIDEGRAFIILEYLEGEDLSERLVREKTLALGHVATLSKQLGKALDAVHAAGIVHRDLKPGNVFLMTAGGEDFVKVLDFGIAMAGAGTSGRITQSGMVLGTPKYMSPEQIKASTEVDYRTDLWAMAVLLYRTITGRCPFLGANAAELVTFISQSFFPRASEIAPGLPPAIDDFFGRAFARNPDARFQSGKELTEAFQAALQEPGQDVAMSAYTATSATSATSAPYRERTTEPGVGAPDSTLRMGPPYYCVNAADVSPESRESTFDAPAQPPSSTPQPSSRARTAVMWDREAETLDGHGNKTDVPSALLAPSQRSRYLVLSPGQSLSEEAAMSPPGASEQDAPPADTLLGERLSGATNALLVNSSISPSRRFPKLLAATVIAAVVAVVVWSRFAHGASPPASAPETASASEAFVWP